MSMSGFKHLVVIAAVCGCGIAASPAQRLRTPLERGAYERVTSHDSLLSYLEQLRNVNHRLELETIGKSVEGRTIPMVRLKPTAPGRHIKVLVFCQQHGNEPSGKEAALVFISKFVAGELNAFVSNIDLFIIPCVNPDGNESAKRANANGKDLNRDHLLLTQPEVRVLHAAYGKIRPEVTLDVHEFSAFRKEFLAAGYVRAVDEQFGAPTNLNIPLAIREFGLKRLFPFLDSALSAQGVQFANYLKMDEPSDTVRPSTTSIDDGRQSFGILNSFSFILEGKNGRKFNDDLKRRTERQLAAICAFLQFVHEQSSAISSLVRSEQQTLQRTRDSVIVRMDYLYTGESIPLPMTILGTKADTTIKMMIAPTVTPLGSVRRPAAYIIPKEQIQIIAWLDRHGIRTEQVSHLTRKRVEIATVAGVTGVWMENKPFQQVSTTIRRESVSLRPGDVTVSLRQLASTMLVTALEPTSMWGIIQSDEFSFLRTIGGDVPIYRVMN